MTERIDVITPDGTVHNLDRLVAQGVQGAGGLMAVPATRGGNLVIPGRHGELPVPGKFSQAATIVLPMWVRGVNPDGSIPDGTDAGARLQFHQNLRDLIALFTVDELIKIRHTLTDGTAREIEGQVTDALQPEVRGTGRWTLGQFSVGINAHDPFWADTADVTQTVTLASGDTAVLTAFDGADAPMEDLLIELGATLNPRLSQPSTGVEVEYAGPVTGDQVLAIDTANWTVTGTSGLDPDLRDISYTGPGTSRWFALKPQPGGPVIRLDFDGGGTTDVTITGRRKYKIA